MQFLELSSDGTHRQINLRGRCAHSHFGEAIGIDPIGQSGRWSRPHAACPATCHRCRAWHGLPIHCFHMDTPCTGAVRRTHLQSASTSPAPPVSFKSSAPCSVSTPTYLPKRHAYHAWIAAPLANRSVKQQQPSSRPRVPVVAPVHGCDFSGMSPPRRRHRVRLSGGLAAPADDAGAPAARGGPGGRARAAQLPGVRACARRRRRLRSQHCDLLTMLSSLG